MLHGRLPLKPGRLAGGRPVTMCEFGLSLIHRRSRVLPTIIRDRNTFIHSFADRRRCTLSVLHDPFLYLLRLQPLRFMLHGAKSTATDACIIHRFIYSDDDPMARLHANRCVSFIFYLQHVLINALRLTILLLCPLSRVPRAVRSCRGRAFGSLHLNRAAVYMDTEAGRSPILYIAQRGWVLPRSCRSIRKGAIHFFRLSVKPDGEYTIPPTDVRDLTAVLRRIYDGGHSKYTGLHE